MNIEFLKALIPTSLGLDDIENIKKSPEKTEELYMQRNDAYEKLRVCVKLINDLVTEYEQKLTSIPSPTTKISVTILNAVGAIFLSIGASDLTNALHIAILIIGGAMIVISDLLVVFGKNVDDYFHSIQHHQEKN